MRMNESVSPMYADAEAARYAGWYDHASEDETSPLGCDVCGSVEDVAYGGEDGDCALCAACDASSSRSVWAPYYDAVYGGEGG